MIDSTRSGVSPAKTVLRKNSVQSPPSLYVVGRTGPPHSEATHVPRPALVWQLVVRQLLTAQDGTGPLLDFRHLE